MNLSVIVPVYNTGKYLQACVDSIIAQNLKDMEIIIVDDGSTDWDTIRLCDTLGEYDRVRIIHQVNRGLSCARNEGMRHAEGKWITFVDSDDTLLPDIYRTALSKACDDVGCIMFGSITVSESGKTMGIDRFNNAVLTGAEIISNVVLPLKTASWNKLFRKEALGQVQFPEGRIHGEDLVFLLEWLTQTSRLMTIETLGYKYIKRIGSITTSQFKQSAFDEIWCKDKAAELISKKFSKFEHNANLWKFRARLNVLRKLTQVKDIRYTESKKDLKKQLYALFPIVKDCVDWKSRTEYLLFKYFTPIYSLLLRLR